MDGLQSGGKDGRRAGRARKKRIKHDPEAESARAAFGKRKDSPEE